MPEQRHILIIFVMEPQYCGKTPSLAEEGMWRTAPLGRCELPHYR